MDLATRERIQAPPRSLGAVSRRSAIATTIVGLAMLVGWSIWWGESLAQGRLVSGQATWVECLPFLAGDFVVHVEPEARILAHGGDPYDVKNGWYCAVTPYPPMIYRLFSWVAWTTPKTAAIAWILASMSVITAGAWGAWRSRRRLGLGRIPLPMLLALIFWSAPVVYALERGQTDTLVIVPILLAVVLLKSGSIAGEITSGAVLGLAAWMKYYPGLMVLGLLALGRRRAVAAFVVVAALIGLIDRDGFKTSIEHAKTVSADMARVAQSVHICGALQHSLSHSWPLVWERTRGSSLAAIPGPVAAAGLLLPIVVWTCLRIARSFDRDRLAYPLMLWLTAAATFALPYSNDYNLIFLPIAVLAVCDRRDSPLVFLLLGLFALAWQPLWMPVDGKVLLAAKLAGLYAAGLSLAARASENRANSIIPKPHFAA